MNTCLDPPTVSDMASASPAPRVDNRADRMGDNMMGDDGANEVLVFVGEAVSERRKSCCCCWSLLPVLPLEVVADERLQAPPEEEICNLRDTGAFLCRNKSEVDFCFLSAII